MTLKCRVVSRQFGAETWDDFELDGISYSGRIPPAEAGALVALYDPTMELISFKGPKVWFTMEPSWHHHFTRDPLGKMLKATLAEDEHLWFGNPNPRFRCPHPTFRKSLSVVHNEQRKPTGVACVSNFGGRGWFMKKHIKLRNRFILSELVDLYGNPDAWCQFMAFPQVWRMGPPSNYKGRSPGNGIHDPAHLDFLSGFKAAVCLENWTEPHYFTEKFVNAARAGCIPIYHAHPTVSQSFLPGAKWVDPVDFDFCPKRTIEYALREPIDEYAATNEAWLKSGVLDATDDQSIIQFIHRILKEKIAE